MKWFKHDSNASSDAKLERVIMKYGLKGYGLYWYCLELIAANVKESCITFELEHDAEVISHRTGINYELVQEMMTYMVNLGLFENKDGTITCLKMAKRLDQSMTSNPDMRKIINKLKGKGNKNHDLVMTESCKKRVDKIRLEERESKALSNKILLPKEFKLSDDMEDYVIKKNSSFDPSAIFSKFINYHTAQGTKAENWDAMFKKWVDDEKQITPGSNDVVDNRFANAI